jgi:RNA polymerase sigma factor (TIGR02999 family)
MSDVPDPSQPASQIISDQVTAVLRLASDGDTNAASRLLPLVYDQLRALARSKMAHVPPGNTLQPTALVHEAYLRIIGDKGDQSWDHRGHFFGAAALAMRDILVEQARHKSSMKAGGNRRRAQLDEAVPLPPLIDDSLGFGEGGRMLALDAALRRFEAKDPRKAEALMLKYFAGLEHDVIAGILGISVPTVDRDLRFGRAWLARELKAANINA